MAKLADVLALGASESNLMEVQVLLPAPDQNSTAFSKSEGGTREATPAFQLLKNPLVLFWCSNHTLCSNFF